MIYPADSYRIDGQRLLLVVPTPVPYLDELVGPCRVCGGSCRVTYPDPTGGIPADCPHCYRGRPYVRLDVACQHPGNMLTRPMDGNYGGGSQTCRACGADCSYYTPWTEGRPRSLWVTWVETLRVLEDDNRNTDEPCPHICAGLIWRYGSPHGGGYTTEPIELPPATIPGQSTALILHHHPTHNMRHETTHSPPETTHARPTPHTPETTP